MKVSRPIDYIKKLYNVSIGNKIKELLKKEEKVLENCLKNWSTYLEYIENNIECLYENIEEFQEDKIRVDLTQLTEGYSNILESFKDNLPSPERVKRELIIYKKLLDKELKKEPRDRIKFREIESIVEEYVQNIKKTTELNREVRILLCIASEGDYPFEYKAFDAASNEIIDKTTTKLAHVWNSRDLAFVIPMLVSDDAIIENDWSVFYSAIKP